VVSLHRLRDEFYGSPEYSGTSGMHERGHTLALPHCQDYQCVMPASHGIELVDLKTSRFCTSWRGAVPSRTELKALNRSASVPAQSVLASGDGVAGFSSRHDGPDDDVEHWNKQ